MSEITKEVVDVRITQDGESREIVMDLDHWRALQAEYFDGPGPGPDDEIDFTVEVLGFRTISLGKPVSWEDAVQKVS